jgi:hypothetical protein
LLTAAIALLAAMTMATVAACGDDDEDGVSPAALEERLFPESELRRLDLEVDRTFTWDNPTDFTVQGLFLPEATPPSDAIETIDDAGFEAAAGQFLRDAFGVGVAQFESEEGANEVRDYLHEQDLQQPCYAACVVEPREFELEGIPGATAVAQLPVEGELPPGTGPPFQRYVVEFTIGPYLYVGDASGPPRLDLESRFEEGVKALYDHVKDLSAEG